MRKKKGEKSWVEKSDITTQEKESERKNRCDKCRWYEHSTQRDFYRKVGPKDENGERELQLKKFELYVGLLRVLLEIT